MDLTAPPSTPLEPPSLPPRPNHLLQGVLAFFAVVGVGTALTLVLYPPVRMRVVTVERPVVVEKVEVREVPVPAAAAPPRPVVTRGRRKKPAPPSVMATSRDCKDDPLCGSGIP